MNPLAGMNPPSEPTDPIAIRHADLTAAVLQAEGDLDRKRGYYERAYRYWNDCPDHDSRKGNALKRMRRIGGEMGVAQTALDQALDRLFDYETEHPELAPAERWPEVKP